MGGGRLVPRGGWCVRAAAPPLPPCPAGTPSSRPGGPRARLRTKRRGRWGGGGAFRAAVLEEKLPPPLVRENLTVPTRCVLIRVRGWGEPVRGRDSASLAGPCDERWEPRPPVPGRDELSTSEPEPSCQRCGSSKSCPVPGLESSSGGATLPSGIGCWGVAGRLPPVRGLLPPVRGRPLVGRPHCRL